MKIFQKVPISIHPTFWLTTLLLALYISHAHLKDTFSWIIVIFSSILFHEYGHALMALVFKERPRIYLVALGGMTSYEGKNLGFGKQFLVTLNGPVFGFLLFVLGFYFQDIFPRAPMGLMTFSRHMMIANGYWTVLNLLPMLPLDGGQLLRIAFEAWLGVKGVRISLILSLLFSFFGGIIAFGLFQEFILGSIFFLFAYQSFELYRQSRLLTASDRQPSLNELFRKGELALEGQNHELAKSLFEMVLTKTKKGVLFASSTYYLALILFEERKKQEAYDLLLTVVPSELPQGGLLMLFELAYDRQNFSLVTQISSDVYTLSPTPEIALKIAKAYAEKSQGKLAGGWLKTALESKKFDLKEVLKDPSFQHVIHDHEFLAFFPHAL